MEKAQRDRQGLDPRWPELGTGRPSEVVRVELLGGFRVTVGPRVVAEESWRLRKAAALVKLLALEPDHRLHKEQAMDLLWPHLAPRSAANNLHRTLYSARRVLEPDHVPATESRYLRLRGEQIELCPGSSLWVDVMGFEEAAAKARRLGDPAAYRAAVDLYAGELLPADRYEPWAEERREGLRQRYISLLLEMAWLYEEPGPAIEALTRVVAEQRTHEGAHAGLMRLYARTGRREEALEQYERLREGLGRCLGGEPGATSRRLRDEILAGRYPPPPTPDGRQAPGATRRARPSAQFARWADQLCRQGPRAGRAQAGPRDDPAPDPYRRRRLRQDAAGPGGGRGLRGGLPRRGVAGRAGGVLGPGAGGAAGGRDARCPRAAGPPAGRHARRRAADAGPSAGAGQLRAPDRSLRPAGRYPPRRVHGAARLGHQQGGFERGGRGRLARAAPPRTGPGGLGHHRGAL